MNLQRLRVPIGFAFGALYLYFASPAPRWFAPGVLLAGVGLALRVWAAGYLEKWVGLAISGPYRWTRNPLYLGSFVMGLGFCAASARPFLLAVFAILFPAVYLPVMRREEEELRAAYTAEFEIYRKQVPLFVPVAAPPSPSGRRQQERFSWSRVWKNREYMAIIGFAVVTVFLYLKMGWQ